MIKLIAAERRGKAQRASAILKMAHFLGISTTNNHASRMALNSHLIAMGLPSTDRTLLLGHDAATNELFYTLTDRRRLDNISQIMHQPQA